MRAFFCCPSQRFPPPLSGTTKTSFLTQDPPLVMSIALKVPPSEENLRACSSGDVCSCLGRGFQGRKALAIANWWATGVKWSSLSREDKQANGPGWKGKTLAASACPLWLRLKFAQTARTTFRTTFRCFEARGTLFVHPSLWTAWFLRTTFRCFEAWGTLFVHPSLWTAWFRCRLCFRRWLTLQGSHSSQYFSLLQQTGEF